MADKTVLQPVPPRTGSGRGGVARTVLAMVSSGLLTSGIWAVVAYSALALPQLTNTTLTNTSATTTFTLTPSQASWFATMPLFMCIPGSVVGGLVGEWAGPRRLQLLLSLMLSVSFMATHLASWRLIQQAGAANVIFMVVRIIQSTIVALLIPTNSMYVCEVSDAGHRGWLASLVEAWVTLGVLLCYLLGRYIHWYTAAWLLPLLTTVPSFFGLLMSPETPPWLVRNGRLAKARQTLVLLRGSPEKMEQEFAELKECPREMNSSCYHSLLLLKSKENYIPLIMSFLILVLKEFSGLSVMTIYLVRIFQLAGVGLEPFWSSFIVGSVRLVFNLLGSALLHRLPRKFLLVGGNVFTTAGTAAIGVFFFLQNRGEDLTRVSWLPLVGLTVYMTGMSVGVMPTSWVLATEVLPGRVRSTGLGAAVMGYAATSFLVSKTFEDVQAAFGLHGLFWSYSLGCLTQGLFVALFVPETRGRSLRDIENSWVQSSGREQMEVSDDEDKLQSYNTSMI